MKKHLFLAAVVGMALTGCVNEESENLTQQQARKISFDTPVMGTQTRAIETVDYNSDAWRGNGEVKGTAFPKSQFWSFGIFANMHEGDYSAWNDGKNFWDWQLDTEWESLNTTFSLKAGRYDQDSDSFIIVEPGNEDEEIYYYPNGYKLSFEAFAPYLDDVEVTCGDDGLTITDYTHFTDNEWINNSSSNCIDLMYTGLVNNYTAENQPETGIPLVFKHTMASIAVVLDIPTVGEFTYSISEITISGDSFITTATFKENYGVEDETPRWMTEDATGESMTFTFYDSDSFNEFPQPDEEDGTIYTLNGGESALLMIPQDVPDDAVMTISYAMRNKLNASEIYGFTPEIKLTDFLKENKETIEKWEMGNRYKYIVRFAQNVRVPLKFNPSIESDWIEGGNAEYTITDL